MVRRYLDQRLRLSLLRACDAMDTHGTLLKASAALGISQPALTKSLRELEDGLQVRLFDRHSRGVRPTEAGLLFVQTARRVLAELRRLDDSLDLLATPGGSILTLGALPVAAAGVLPGVLAKLRCDYPQLKVQLQQGRTEELLPLLVSGEIDFVVGRLYDLVIPDAFEREALWTEPVSIFARSGHPIFDEPATVGQLDRCDFVLPTITQRVGQEIEHLFSLLGISSDVSLRSSSHVFIREMLHGTDMLSVMPRSMMVGDLMRGTLRVVPLPVATPDRPAGLISRRGDAKSPAHLIFVDCVRAYVQHITSCVLSNPITEGNNSAKKNR